MDDRTPVRTVASNDATDGSRPAGIENGRRWIWIGVVAAATVASSFALACATPFAALATLAAVKMHRRDAVALVGIAWLANQILGYGFLGYPRTFDSYAWGAALGAASFLALAGAGIIIAWLRQTAAPVGIAVAFLSAFAVYEAALFAASLALSTGAEALSWSITLWILELNAVALVGLLALDGLGRLAGFAAGRRALARRVTTAV